MKPTKLNDVKQAVLQRNDIGPLVDHLNDKGIALLVSLMDDCIKHGYAAAKMDLAIEVMERLNKKIEKYCKSN